MPRPKRTDQIAFDPDDDTCYDGVVHVNAVRRARQQMPTVEEIDEMSMLLAALGDPTRLRIVAALSSGELCVCDLAATVGLSESAASHQLRRLRDLGLVRPRREGRMMYYALDDAHVSQLYDAAREHVLHRQGETA